MEKKIKIIIILGQTSTGKSDFAVNIAKEIRGEIISADSRQVYTDMDLGTGKITKKEMKKIPHYLLDVISPSKVFSVNDYQKLADKKIKEIFNNKKVPIICGGTGFYIDTVVNGTILPKVKPNKKLRKELNSKTNTELIKILEELDNVRAKNIDQNNKIRLIRAIEIAKSLGKIPTIKQSSSIEKYQILKIGLTLPDEILKERIKIRLLSRIKKGMIKEVENLHKNGVSFKRMYNLGLEYRYVSLFLQKKLTKDAMIEKLNTEIWHFAKRQKTWFKRDKNTIWINPSKIDEISLAIKKIKEFLK